MPDIHDPLTLWRFGRLLHYQWSVRPLGEEHACAHIWIRALSWKIISGLVAKQRDMWYLWQEDVSLQCTWLTPVFISQVRWKVECFSRTPSDKKLISKLNRFPCFSCIEGTFSSPPTTVNSICCRIDVDVFHSSAITSVANNSVTSFC